MKDDDFFRDCIDQFNESQKKGKKLDVFSPELDVPQGNTRENTELWVEKKDFIPFFLFVLLSFLYLNSMELAGALAIYRETGDFMLPEFSANLTMGSVGLAYVHRAITAFRASGMVDNLLLLGFFMTRFLFLLETEIRGGRNVSKGQYALGFVVLFFLHIFATLTNLEPIWQKNSSCHWVYAP